MGGLFSSLLAKLTAIVAWVSDLVKAVFKAAWDMVSDAFAWVLEQLMDIAQATISVLDFTTISAHLGTFAAIPATALEVLAASGVGTGLAIVGSAIVVRMALQLIPFTRLGS